MLIILLLCAESVEEYDAISLKDKIRDIKKWRATPSPGNRLKFC